ncbi:MAG TPA: hypothetical protein VG488_01310 [Candidatus Angelobacter sp.]|nr:hypothetical protein [Candidatus Angelobacter sp.]
MALAWWHRDWLDLRTCASLFWNDAVVIIGLAVPEYSFCNFLVDFMSRSAVWIARLLGDFDDHDFRLLFHLYESYCAIAAPKKHVENTGLTVKHLTQPIPKILCQRNSFTASKKTNNFS